jgi:hypothetical protein
MRVTSSCNNSEYDLQTGCKFFSAIDENGNRPKGILVLPLDSDLRLYLTINRTNNARLLCNDRLTDCFFFCSETQRVQMPRSRNIRRERKTKKSPPEFPFGRQKEKEEKTSLKNVHFL